MTSCVQTSKIKQICGVRSVHNVAPEIRTHAWEWSWLSTRQDLDLPKKLASTCVYDGFFFCIYITHSITAVLCFCPHVLDGEIKSGM